MSFPSASSVVSSSFKPFSPPLSYDERSNEPYLPLPPPLGPRIRITPLRMNENSDLQTSEHSDLLSVVHYLNLPEISFMLTGPPYPFTHEYGVGWVAASKKECADILQEMERVVDSGFVSGCPVRVIRERQDDGTDVYLGDIVVARSRFPEIRDPTEKERLIRRNCDLPIGDPTIVWSFGYFMTPTYQGRGIMPTALRTLLHDWVVPRMGGKHFAVTAMSHNLASQKVLTRNGFRFVEEQEDAIDVEKLGKGKGKVGLKLFSLDL